MENQQSFQEMQVFSTEGELKPQERRRRKQSFLKIFPVCLGNWCGFRPPSRHVTYIPQLLSIPVAQ